MADANGKEMGPEQGPQAAESSARREFLTRIGKAGVAVPAISLLLAANFQVASAQQGGGSGSSGPSGGSGSS
jgi:hypothetical protein